MKIHGPSQFCNLTFCLSVECHEELKIARLQFNLSTQWRHCESLSETILFLGAETVKPAELELQPWGQMQVGH